MHKTGRNDPCPCGSGKKFKHCCQNQQRVTSVNQVAIPDSKISAALHLASEYFNVGQVDEAVALCQRILQLSPEHAETLNLMGIMAFQLGKMELAVTMLTRAVRKAPNYADAHNNLGVIYKELHNFEQASACFSKAIRLNPDYVDALINYGGILQDLNRHEEALTYYQRVLSIRPEHTGALSNLGNVLQELNRHHDAIDVFTRLISIDPDYDYAYGGLAYSRIYCCQWEQYDQDLLTISAAIKSGKRVCKPFELLPVSDDPGMQLTCAKLFATHLYPTKTQPPQRAAAYKHDKIRLAYLSADFRQHPVSQLLVEVIEQHDRDKFDVIGISFGHDDGSELRQRMMQAFDRFIDVSHKGDEEVASLMREMEIDIAVDLMGFTTNARMGIFSLRPAPVQVSFLGYAGTSGTDYIDFILGDTTVMPVASDQYYSEKLVRLPDSYLPHDSKREISKDIPTRSHERLPAHGFVFCAFNNQFKITPQIFDVWMRLLSKVEGSVLWLSRCNPTAKENLLSEASKRGVSAERLVFAERTTTLADHLARHKLADLFLDTSPYNAHTTASDALWAGVPVLTCQARTFSGRVASSLLTALGLTELIVDTLEEYESLALQLAENPDKIGSIKKKLRENVQGFPLFNTPRYLLQLEAAYTKMWQQPLKSEDRHGFDI